MNRCYSHLNTLKLQLNCYGHISARGLCFIHTRSSQLSQSPLLQYIHLLKYVFLIGVSLRCLQDRQLSEDLLGMAGMIVDIPEVSEDCLYLNVYTPAQPAQDAMLPVSEITKQPPQASVADVLVPTKSLVLPSNL